MSQSRLMSKKFPALMACVGLLALSLAMSACGSDSTSSSSSTGDATAEETGSSAPVKSTGITLGYVPATIENPILKAMAEAVELKGESLGLAYSQYGGVWDPQAQIEAIRAANSAKVDVLGVFPIDPSAIQGPLEQTHSEDIPVIAQASPDVPNVVTNIETNDQEAAKELAEYAAEALKEEGTPCAVGIIQGLEVVNILQNRNLGLEEGAKAAGCKILDKQVNQEDTSAGARPIASGWATKYGSEMTVVLAYNDPSALGASSARQGDFDPVITGMNGDPEGLEAVEQGRLLATMKEPVVPIGNVLAQVAYDTAVSKEEVPETIWLSYDLLDSETIKTHPTLAEELESPMSVAWEKQGDRYLATATQE